MATLTVQSVTEAGTGDILAALSNASGSGDAVIPAGALLIVMNNADASSHTLTVGKPSATEDTSNLGSLVVADLTLVVAAGKHGFLVIPPGFAQSSLMSWTYDAVTSVKIGVFSLKF